MPHVEVDPPPVEKEATVSGGFIPISVVEVDQPMAVRLEDPIADFLDDFPYLKRWIDQATILRLQAGDTAGGWNRRIFWGRVLHVPRFPENDIR